MVPFRPFIRKNALGAPTLSAIGKDPCAPAPESTRPRTGTVRPGRARTKARFSLASILTFLAASSLTGAVHAAPAADAKGSRDHPRISRFKGSTIRSHKAEEFGRADILISVPKDKKVKSVDGRVTHIVYDIPKGHAPHEVYRSYLAELERSGFQTLFSCEGAKPCNNYDFPVFFQESHGFMGNTQVESIRYLAAGRTAPGGNTYVSLYAYSQGPEENRAILTVVDEASMEAGLVKVTAEAIARDIASDGHAVVNGILFDTDSDALKEESEAALREMAALLAENTSLKVYVVGHTDNAGQPARNLDLSQKRASSVVKALVTRHRVDPKRLEARGIGSLAPMASNRSEAGRTKNRRVELVER